MFSGDGITINAGATDTVVLRGLTINGQGGANGITINNALTVHVENCVIANMGDKGIYQVAGTLDVKDTIVRDGVWGIFVQAPGRPISITFASKATPPASRRNTGARSQCRKVS